ncbi:MAG: hypothetical protein QXK96_04950 [Candidatus Bathyarchaeia archaeon]
MVNIKVFVTQLSGERLWDADVSLPSQLQISINVNLLGFERRSAEMIETPFVFTASFTPSVAQINIKGKAQASGTKEELDKMMNDFKNQKAPPALMVQAVSSVAIAEAIVMSKTIGVPPPLPPLLLPQEQTKPGTGPVNKYTA